MLFRSGTFAELPKAIEERFGGAADSVDIHFPPGTAVGLMKEIVADIRHIPHVFEGFDTNW
mgnify:CR=1 FL=1